MTASPRPIALMTDFGLRDPYAGIMKCVIERIAPGAAVIDLTHDIPPQDLTAAQVALEDCLPWLPPEAVVCAVVDPGVGSERRALRVEAPDGRTFIAPDNGLLTPVLTPDARVFSLRPGGEIRPAASATFHGRDVFSPAAALAACGHAPEETGEPIGDPVRAPLPEPAAFEPGALRLQVLTVDHFGNCALNLRREQADVMLPGFDPRRAGVMAGGRIMAGISRTFSDTPAGRPLALWNSAGRLEIAVNGGSAAEQLRLSPGSEAFLRTRPAD